jgi:hypothetical protein
MNKETKDILTLGIPVAILLGAVVFVPMATIYFFGFIEDTIKYNRYQDAVKEYRQCAQKYRDDYSVKIYCGDSPPSTIML